MHPGEHKMSVVYRILYTKYLIMNSEDLQVIK